MLRSSSRWMVLSVVICGGCAAPASLAGAALGPPSAPPPPVALRYSTLLPAVALAPSPDRIAGPALLPTSALASAPAPVEAAPPTGPRSSTIRNGFHNPMPGGVMAGYQADTGLDIAGSPRPVYALASGTLDYSEPGHTLWTGPSDTANCVRFELDAPIAWKGRRITHVYYAHLSRLEHILLEGETPRRHVDAGELLGTSGIANHSPHLHIGLLLDGEVEQYWGTFLRADEVRKVLGGYRNGDILPRE